VAIRTNNTRLLLGHRPRPFQQRPRVPFSFPIRRISLSAFNSSSLTLQRRHVGLPLRRRVVGFPQRMQGFAGMVFLAMAARISSTTG
jgi:hypothetical protein